MAIGWPTKDYTSKLMGFGEDTQKRVEQFDYVVVVIE